MSASDFRYINHEDSLLAKIYPGLLHLNESISRRFSPAGNLEAMLQLRPGAIFAYSLSYAEPLRRLGLPVISFPIIRGKIPQSDYYRHALQYERVLGITGRADELWKRFQAGFARLKAELGDVTVRPRVMLALTKQPDNSFQVVGGGELLGDFLYLAGGRALDNAGRAFLNPEQVMMQNPDVILLLSLTELSPADFYSDPRFASLSAVRSRRVYKVPTGILDSQTFPNNIVESPLFCEWLAELIHPEVMPRDLRPVIRSTYAAVFGYTISNPELDRILSLNANAASMGYRRFEQ
ncbi:MAG: ABC transporter substrate-binding protein [Acidobacteriia bacterium]|nr:ABC transporter substrate-binding protein [Terriglobia bacterium]